MSDSVPSLLKVATVVLIVMNAIGWTALVVWGAIYNLSILSQSAAGHPNLGQIGFWLLIPLAILLISIVRPVRRLRAGMPQPGVWLLVATLILLPFYAQIYLVGG